MIDTIFMIALISWLILSLISFILFKYEEKKAVVIDASAQFLHDDYDPRKDKTLNKEN